MGFDLDADQREFAGWVREVAAPDCPHRRRRRAGPGQPRPTQGHGSARALGQAFSGVSEGRATREAAAMELCLLRESLAGVSTEAETALALQGLGTYPVLQSGSAAQVDRWVPAVAAGDAVAAFALTEPEAARTPPRCGSRPSRTAADGGCRGRRCGSRTRRMPTSTRSSPGQLRTPGPGSQRVRRARGPAGPVR